MGAASGDPCPTCGRPRPAGKRVINRRYREKNREALAEMERERYWRQKSSPDM